MTMRRGTTALLLALLVLTAPSAVAAPAADEGALARAWMGEWLADLQQRWLEALGLEAPSETEPTPNDTTTTEEPTPPGGELGPWIGPDGLADEGPEQELDE